MIESPILICDCKSLDHVYQFSYDDEDSTIYLQTRLTNHRNFFKRLWRGLGYIFGKKSRYGDMDEIIMSIESIKELNIFTEKVITHYKKYLNASL